MRKRLSELKARGSVIVGHGAMLKVLLVSIALVVVAFLVIAVLYGA
jgi:hypothetical protein